MSLEQFDNFKREVVAQISELKGQSLTEQQVSKMFEELSQPIYEELKAQAEARKLPVSNTTKARTACLRGTKWDRFADPMTGRRFDADDIELAHDILVTAHETGGLRCAGPSEQLRNLYAEIKTRTPDPDLAETRAMDTAESGYGAELVGVEYVSQLWRAAYQQSVIFGLIPSREMMHPTAYLPVGAAFPEMLYVSENTSATASDYTTSKTGSNRVEVAARKFIIHQVYSGEMEEDSIVPWVPFLREMATNSLAFYTDSCVLNGDTTNAATGNINLDDADPPDTKHYLAFDGIRHVGIVDNTNNQDNVAGALVYDDLLNARQRMLDTTNKVNWGFPSNPNDLVYVCDLEGTFNKIALLDEVITVDKYGSQATVLNGEQAKIGRHPLVGTLAMGLTEADGKISTTAGNNTKGQVAVFNRLGFVVGWRRRVKLETENLPGRDQTRIVWSLRMGLGRHSKTGAASGIECADVLYNITV